MKKFLVVVSLISLAIFAFFFSNIKGYYRFKQYCEAEGGLRVYEPLERNVGWLAEDKYEARTAALLDGVGFVRYTEKDDRKSYDIKYIGGDPQNDSSFEKRISDKERFIVYKWRFLSPDNIDGALRLHKFGYEIYAVNTSNLVARYYMYSYAVFANVFLGGSSDVECFHDITRGDEPSNWRKGFNGSFKN